MIAIDMESVVERAKKGDRAALEEVLAEIAPQVHRFGLRMCKNGHDADDVLQETLLAVTKHLGDFEGRSSLSSWVFTLARTACARRRRGLKNRPPESEEGRPEAPDPAPSPEARAADQELRDAINVALSALPEEHREVILLRDVEGLSAPEAAEALEISVDALKSRLHRAREGLRRALKPLLEPAGPAPTDCPDIVAMWSKKLEGDLSQTDCGAMEQHIKGCPTCGAACDALKTALGACRRVASGDVPPAVQRQVKAAMRAFVDGIRP